MSFKVTLTPKAGGSAITVQNVIDYGWGSRCFSDPSNRAGMDGHSLDQIQITRHCSLNPEGMAALDLDTVNLHAATGEDRYFSGETKISHPDDPANPIETDRFEGYIDQIQRRFSDGGFTETLLITVTKLEVGDATLKHSFTP